MGKGPGTLADDIGRMITVKEYAAHRGVSAPRISQLIKQGRLDAVVVREGRRVFLTSAEAADQALEDSAAGPRGKTARQPDQTRKSGENRAPQPVESSPSTIAISSPTTPAPLHRAARSKGRRRKITDIKPESMSRGEAIDAKAIYDAEQSRLKAAKLALENDHAAGKLIAVADAERQTDTWTARVVSMVSALPSRVAQAGVSAAVVAVVRREINRMREEIARGGDDAAL